MHIRRGYLGWGVVLFLTGAVPLAFRSGYLNDEQIGRLWTLWPLILIWIGVGLILSRTRFDFIGGRIVAATLGLMPGAAPLDLNLQLSASSATVDLTSVEEIGGFDVGLNAGSLGMTLPNVSGPVR